jgi:pimeloyl-ACP methyl ester carboxylesterase
MAATSERVLSAFNDTVETHVMVAGSGPPVVFLHGAGGLTWDGFLDDLADHFTVFAPAHPGTAGDPDAVRNIRGLWELVLYYYEVFDQLGLQSPAVVGHSFGGMVAAELAATNPERVGKLVLISSIGLWRDDHRVKDWMGMPQEELTELVFYDPNGPLAQEMTAVPDDPDERTELTVRRTWALACTGEFVWPIPDKGLSRRIHRVTAPSLIVWGRQDGLVPPIYAEEFASRLPNAQVELVDKAAHVPQLEQRELVSSRVIDFLR